MTAKELVADLTYLNYEFNRDLAPHISPERWAQAYGPGALAMEARYQAEHKRSEPDAIDIPCAPLEEEEPEEDSDPNAPDPGVWDINGDWPRHHGAEPED